MPTSRGSTSRACAPRTPGPFTLVGHEHLGRRAATRPGSSIPGPRSRTHLDAVAAEVEARGGAGGIALTHDHCDHVEGVPALRERLGRPPVAAARFAADVRLADGDAFGPFAAHAVPGHADDHLVFVAGGACFTGDAVLGEGSVFVAGRPRELPRRAAAPARAAARA